MRCLNYSYMINLDLWRSERSEWLRFWRRFLLFVLVQSAIFITALETVAWRLGETVPRAVAARQQLRIPNLVWESQRFENDLRYKQIRLDQERPEVLIMGQSRVGQIRGVLFQPYSFYNFSRVSWPFRLYSELLRRMPSDYAPKIIIFSTDFFMFGPGYNTGAVDPTFHASFWIDHWNALVDVFAAVGKTPSLIGVGNFWAEGTPSLHYDGGRVMGLLAETLSQGFRADGSEQWPGEAMQNLKKGEGFTAPDPSNLGGPAVDPQECRYFEEFVKLARAKKITLIGVQMPIYPLTLQKLEQSPCYGPLLKSFNNLASGGYFERQGVLFFDRVRYAPYGNDISYWFGWMHPGEPLTAAALLDVMSDPRVHTLLPLLDIDKVHRAIEANQSANQHVFLDFPREFGFPPIFVSRLIQSSPVSARARSGMDSAR